MPSSHLCRLIVPGAVARDRGHVINTSSIAGNHNFGGNSTHHAAKAGVARLSNQLRIDAFGKRVRVRRNLPCRVATDIFNHVHGNDPSVRERLIDGFELPQASDIADGISFAHIAYHAAVSIGHRGNSRPPCRSWRGPQNASAKPLSADDPQRRARP